MSNVVVCRPALPVVETSHEHWATRWCFACRGRHGFDLIVHGFAESDVSQLIAEIESGQRPEDDMWHLIWGEPRSSVECSNCGQTDGDVGFGQVREWAE